jgi:hypothetical protein
MHIGAKVNDCTMLCGHDSTTSACRVIIKPTKPPLPAMHGLMLAEIAIDVVSLLGQLNSTQLTLQQVKDPRFSTNLLRQLLTYRRCKCLLCGHSTQGLAGATPIKEHI